MFKTAVYNLFNSICTYIHYTCVLCTMYMINQTRWMILNGIYMLYKRVTMNVFFVDYLNKRYPESLKNKKIEIQFIYE